LCLLWGLAVTALADAVTAAKAPLPFQAGAAVSLTPFTPSVQIGNQIRYVSADVSAPDALQAVPAADWQVNSGGTISMGFQSRPYWFEVNLQTRADTPRHWIFEQGNSMIDHLAVYLYRNGELEQEWHTGDALPFDQRPLVNTRFQFPLELQPDTRYQIYLRVESTEALELPLVLNERDYHARYSDQRAMLEGVFFGFLIIMAAYSLSIYVILRDRSYLNYVCYVASMLLFFLSQQGLLYEYVFPDSPRLQHYSVPWVSLLIFQSIVSFFRSFLGFEEHFPRMWKAYQGQIFLHLVLCLALFVLPYQVLVSLMAVNVAASMLLAVSMILRLSWQGSRYAQIVLFGWGVLFFFIWLFVLARMGVFYNDFLAIYGLRMGVSMEILVFSFALSFRIHQERREKEWALNKINQERNERIRAQELALDREKELRQAREEALHLEISHRESLQQLVDERTADLEATLQDLERANQELEQLSSRDGLTGLYNRRFFDGRMTELWNEQMRRQKPFAVLLLDVDHFKNINDSKGHPCGDMVLQELARMLGQLLRRPTDVICRYGGEEFAVLLPDTPLEGAERVAQNIVQTAMEKVYQWEGKTLHATVSVGVHCLVPAADKVPAQLIQGADQALYQAKRTGRNRYVLFADDADSMRQSG